MLNFYTRTAGHLLIKTKMQISDGFAVHSNGLGDRSNGFEVRSNGFGIRSNGFGVRSNGSGVRSNGFAVRLSGCWNPFERYRRSVRTAFQAVRV